MSNTTPTGEPLPQGPQPDDPNGTQPNSPELKLGPVISTGPIEEDEPPGSRLTPPSTTPEQQREKTRTWVAFALVGALIGLAVAGIVGWFMYGNDAQRMQSFGVVFGPIVTLVGTVLGFYFSSKKD